jgi:hypothetical protein
MAGGYGALREDEKQNAATVDRLHDGVGVEVARTYIPWSDPATDACGFESDAQKLRDRPVLGGVRDERRT